MRFMPPRIPARADQLMIYVALMLSLSPILGCDPNDGAFQPSKAGASPPPEVTGDTNVQVGGLVTKNSSQPLTTIVPLDPISVRFKISEAEHLNCVKIRGQRIDPNPIQVTLADNFDEPCDDPCALASGSWADGGRAVVIRPSQSRPITDHRR
jgi:hypothetical protein